MNYNMFDASLAVRLVTVTVISSGLFLIAGVVEVEASDHGRHHSGHHSTSDSTTEDIHGGVPMGVPNNFCDNAVNYTSIDWDSSSSDEYTCLEDRDLNALKDSYSSCEQQAKRPIHQCYPMEIKYDEAIPTSGTHRPLWPKYGEYLYLPPQRWLHSLEHGAIVFLYNPCADPDQIRKFKAIGRGCLRRHIISPSKRVPKPYMFALAAWQCKLVMTRPDVPRMVEFIRDHALHSPERKVYADGQYDKVLLHPAKIVSDLVDSSLCPRMSMMSEVRRQIASSSKKRMSRLERLEEMLKLQVDSLMSI